MSIFKKPIVFSEDTKQHREIIDGQKLEPSVIPVSSAPGNQAKMNDDGLFLGITDQNVPVSNEPDNQIQKKTDGLFVGKQKLMSSDLQNMLRLGSDGALFLDANAILSNGGMNLLTVSEVDGRIILNQSAISPASFIRPSDKILFEDDGKIGASLSLNYDQFTGRLELLGYDGQSLLSDANIPSAGSSLKGVEATNGMPAATGQAVEGDYHLSFLFSNDGQIWTPGSGATIRTTKGHPGTSTFQVRLPAQAQDMTQARVFFLGEEKQDTGTNEFDVVFTDGSTAHIELTHAGDTISGEVTFTPGIGIQPGVYLHFIWMLNTGELSDTYVDITQYIGVYQEGQGIAINGQIISVKLQPGGGLAFGDSGLKVDTDTVISDDAGNALKRGSDGKLMVDPVDAKVYQPSDSIEIDDTTLKAKLQPGGGLESTPTGMIVAKNALVSTEPGNAISVDSSGKLFATDYGEKISSMSTDVAQAKQDSASAKQGVADLRTEMGNADTDYVKVFEEALTSPSTL